MSQVNHSDQIAQALQKIALLRRRIQSNIAKKAARKKLRHPIINTKPSQKASTNAYDQNQSSR